MSATTKEMCHQNWIQITWLWEAVEQLQKEIAVMKKPMPKKPMSKHKPSMPPRGKPMAKGMKRGKPDRDYADE